MTRRGRAGDQEELRKRRGMGKRMGKRKRTSDLAAKACKANDRFIFKLINHINLVS